MSHDALQRKQTGVSDSQKHLWTEDKDFTTSESFRAPRLPWIRGMTDVTVVTTQRPVKLPI